MNRSFEKFMKDCQSRIENLFLLYLHSNTSPASRLQEAMNYSSSNGGKRIRPLLVYATGIALGATWDSLDAPACAIELIHTYSLIHDDLPAMDNADLRRGKPSCHKAFDEALAILAGDALQPLAFEVLSSHPAPLNSTQRLFMIKTLSNASGFMGMAAGQALDIASVNTLEALKQIHALKTGALINAGVKLGMIAANNQNQHIEIALTKFSELLGLAFQIQDDLMDIESSAEITGKPQGLDAENQKITYPDILGVEETRITINDLFSRILQTIEFLGTKADILLSLSDYILQRKK